MILMREGDDVTQEVLYLVSKNNNKKYLTLLSGHLDIENIKTAFVSTSLYKFNLFLRD